MGMIHVHGNDDELDQTLFGVHVNSNVGNFHFSSLYEIHNDHLYRNGIDGWECDIRYIQVN